MLLISVLGLVVNIIGLIFFHEHAHIGHSKSKDLSCKHNKLEKLDSNDSSKGLMNDEESPSPRAVTLDPKENENTTATNFNLQGMFLHVVADTLGSISVIISAVCIKYFGLYIADPICCFVISFLILISVIPILKRMITLLLLGHDGRLAG